MIIIVVYNGLACQDYFKPHGSTEQIKAASPSAAAPPTTGYPSSTTPPGSLDFCTPSGATGQFRSASCQSPGCLARAWEDGCPRLGQFHTLRRVALNLVALPQPAKNRQHRSTGHTGKRSSPDALPADVGDIGRAGIAPEATHSLHRDSSRSAPRTR